MVHVLLAASRPVANRSVITVGTSKINCPRVGVTPTNGGRGEGGAETVTGQA